MYGTEKEYFGGKNVRTITTSSIVFNLLIVLLLHFEQVVITVVDTLSTAYSVVEDNIGIIKLYS